MGRLGALGDIALGPRNLDPTEPGRLHVVGSFEEIDSTVPKNFTLELGFRFPRGTILRFGGECFSNGPKRSFIFAEAYYKSVYK